MKRSFYRQRAGAYLNSITVWWNLKVLASRMTNETSRKNGRDSTASHQQDLSGLFLIKSGTRRFRSGKTRDIREKRSEFVDSNAAKKTGRFFAILAGPFPFRDDEIERKRDGLNEGWCQMGRKSVGKDGVKCARC